MKIPLEWASILINSGEDSSSISDQYFNDNSYFANRFSRRFNTKNIDIIIYARDNEVSLEQAIWYYYKIEEKNLILKIKKFNNKEKKGLQKRMQKKLRKFGHCKNDLFIFGKKKKNEKKREFKNSILKK